MSNCGMLGRLIMVLSSPGALLNRLYFLKDRLEGNSWVQTVKAFVATLVKIVAFFRLLLCRSGRRQENVPSLRTIEHNVESQPSVGIVQEDPVLPFLERIQRLETIFCELSAKPPEIPMDKEAIILESLDRIKSIEFDLEKTKKVRLSTEIYFLY